MSKIKIMTVFGTRPEASKMGPLIKVLKQSPEVDAIVAVTAQHREQLDQTLDIFGIKPDYDLNIMKPRQTLADITSYALKGIEEIINGAKPDLVLVHGDTTTTFAASLAAHYCKTKLGHVEAGLRTYDKFQPFPEEMNRRLTSALADLHFAPTSKSKENLIKENISAQTIYVTGNTAIDCLRTTLEEGYTFSRDSLNRLDPKKKLIVMTAHRRENLGAPLENICRAAKRFIQRYPDTLLVYAVHLNPAVRETVYPILEGTDRIVLTDPLDLKDMHNLMNKSHFVLTDSGGLQEEVPSMGKPVLVLRNVTERPEAVEAGTVALAGVSEENVLNACIELMENSEKYNRMAQAKNPYGDGYASERILEAVLSDAKVWQSK
ncbi:MAG: UDP-N-acetylglucosamine 2-epimerase (non-hydrolyzing) [Clostridiales bacterium]|jgi:UDP-N-acetylglucosamine 2-epimerase|nr:UDP-N-acetylglucosamine 2-epimerase (non-hydrolyzing) [Clostridiales bacterium]